MCELMGLSFERPISADFSIREFSLRDCDNANGWGLAWYPDRSVTIAKEPVEWRQSAQTRFLETYQGLRSKVYIAHVRHQTTGGVPTHADTHPFSRELHGRDYCFAHNGTVPSFRDFALGRYRPVGATDSEHIFCHLLSKMDQREHLLNAPDGWQWLYQELLQLNRHGKLNCLISDGQRLFCYHDIHAWKGLTLRKLIVREGQERRFDDIGISLDVKEDDVLQSVNHGYVVATRALTATGWSEFIPGELVVLENGTLRYSSHPDHRSFVPRETA